MRAARLLQILLMLQNRGRMNSAQLALELEVSRRTILRDVDAMTEAGLPIIVFQGNAGGIELGFNYRTRLTGLAADEAEALGIILSYPMAELEELGVSNAARRARQKLLESLPDGVREKAQVAGNRFQFDSATAPLSDPRVKVLTKAIQQRFVVRLRYRSKQPHIVHPVGLLRCQDSWSLIDENSPDRPIPSRKWADINISRHRF